MKGVEGYAKALQFGNCVRRSFRWSPRPRRFRGGQELLTGACYCPSCYCFNSISAFLLFLTDEEDGQGRRRANELEIIQRISASFSSTTGRKRSKQRKNLIKKSGRDMWWNYYDFSYFFFLLCILNMANYFYRRLYSRCPRPIILNGGGREPFVIIVDRLAPHSLHSCIPRAHFYLSPVFASPIRDGH